MNGNFLDLNNIASDNKKITSDTKGNTPKSDSSTGGGSLFESLLRDVGADQDTKDIKSTLNSKDNTKKDNTTAKNEKIDTKSDSKNISSKITRDVASSLVDMVSKEVDSKTIKDQKQELPKEKVDLSKVKIEKKVQPKQAIVKDSKIDQKVELPKEKVDLSKVKIEKKDQPKQAITKDNKIDQKQELPKEKVELPKVEVEKKDQPKQAITKDSKIDQKVELPKEKVELPKVKVEKKDQPKQAITKDNKIDQKQELPKEKVELTKTDDLKKEQPKQKLTTNSKIDQKIEIPKQKVELPQEIKREIPKVEVIKKDVPKQDLEKDIKIESDDVKKDDIKVENRTLESIIPTNQVLEQNREKNNNISSEKLDKTIDHIGNIAKNLIDEVLQDIDLEDKKTTKDDIKNSNATNIKNDKTKVEDPKNPFIANMFLSSQKTSQNMVASEQLQNAQQNFKNDKTIKGMTKSANMLDLNMTDVKLERAKDEDISKKIEKEKKLSSETKNKIDIAKNRVVALDKMVIEKSLDQRDSQTKADIKKDQPKDTKIETNKVEPKTTTTTTNNSEITMNVPKDVVETIQNKIVGAQQKVNNFMSDMARNMYLNYKPPVHTFKVNLNPSNMGNISVVIKNNKADNSLNVSMNMSNASTMDMFVENKSTLQNALMKNFSGESNVNLSFDMQGGSSDGSSGQFDQDQQNSSLFNNSEVAKKPEDNMEEQQTSQNLEYI